MNRAVGHLAPDEALEPRSILAGRVSLSPAGAVIVVAFLVALALRLYQLTRPGYLLGVTEYDDGPYFSSAVFLLRGVVPYRDFVIVQPPGITLLMVPCALLAKVTGTAWGMAAARILTALASAAGVVLVGLLVRHRGVLVTLLATGILAVFPASVAASHTLLVEPWLTLFCLIGAVAVFDRNRLTTRARRLVWGGVAFGFGGAVELWAIMPVLVVAALALASRAPAPGLAPRIRRAALFISGVAAGFLIPVVPFAATSIRGFYRSLIVAQVGPREHPHRVGLWTRINNMLGLNALHVHNHSSMLIVAVLVVCLAGAVPALAWALTSRPPAPLEWFAVGATALVTGMFLWPAQFHYHFPAFLAPFLGLAIALPVGWLLEAALVTPAFQGETWLRSFAPGVAGLLIVGLAVLEVRAEIHPHGYARMTPAAATALQQMERVVPPGACVVTDQISYLIAANRLTSDVPGCPVILDGLGTDLALSGGLRPSTGAGNDPAVAALWRNAFSHAQYLWLTFQNGRRIAWSPALRAYVKDSFVLVLRDTRGDSLYARKHV